MLQTKLIKLTTKAYQFSLRKLAKSIEKQEARELKKFDKGLATAESLEEFANELKSKATAVRAGTRTHYGKRTAELTAASNIISNIVDDVDNQVKHMVY